MKKNQTEIKVMECGCATTDNKNGVIFGLKAKDIVKAKMFVQHYDEIVRLKEEAIKRIDDKIDKIDSYIDQYNTIIRFLEEYSNSNFELSWNKKMACYIVYKPHVCVTTF